MPAFVNPRELLISWRPSAEFVNAWVARLKSQLETLCDGLEVVDVRAKATENMALAGADGRAGPREDVGKEFLAVYTVDYCRACDAEAEASELVRLSKGLAPTYGRRWVARLEKAPPWDVRLKGCGVKPWDDPKAWVFLPSRQLHFSQYNERSERKHEQQIDDEIYELAVRPIRDPDQEAPP